MAILTPNSVGLHEAPRRCRHWHDLCLGLCGWMVMAMGALACNAQQPPVSEYQVKAAFLVNFPKYVDWPEKSFAAPTSPIVIVVLGETKMTEELKKVATGRTVNGREIVLKHCGSDEEPGVCHILFISASEEQHLPKLLAKVRDTSTLTVGESGDFLENGGIMNLARRDQKIALEINLPAAERVQIKVSSQLLRVASVTKGKAK
jgi:hypothetical protein